MNRLLLIRHAQSEHHIRGLTGGWTDSPLSQLGSVQARALADYCRQRLGSEPSPCLFTSDLQRAAQTAGYLAAALSVECQLEPALREIGNGVAAGLTQDEAKRIELPMTQPAIDWVPYPGAESWRMMTERVFAGMDRIERACRSTGVVVTHGNAGVAVIQWWFRIGEQCREGISFELDAASVSELAVNAWGERTIVRLNDVSHLWQLDTGS
jgi:broad specificity phosphatase PhoE